MNILRLGPVSGISIGLVSLAAFLLLIADLLFGLLPDAGDVAKQVRKRTSEALAVQLTALVQTDQIEALRRRWSACSTLDAASAAAGLCAALVSAVKLESAGRFPANQKIKPRREISALGSWDLAERGCEAVLASGRPLGRTCPWHQSA